VTLFIGRTSGKLDSMKKHLNFKLIILLGLLSSFSNALLAKEELTVVQTVSKDRRSFVISKGLKDGISKGQEIVFATDNVSIVCKATLVNRDFSLWTPLDRTITIPFNKEEIVSANSTVYGNVALDIVGSPEAIKGVSVLPGERNADEYIDFVNKNSFLAKLGYNRGLSQTSSSVSEDKSTTRIGYGIGLEYNWRLRPDFEIGLGGRIDNEVFRITDPELDISTNRIMMITSATYHLLTGPKEKNNFYFSIAAGFGKSTTTVSEEKATGAVTLLPEARVGYLMQFSRTTAMVFEGSIESLSTKEQFTDGSEQTSNARNIKFSIGLRF
jgi:hypothetical protein